jgi:hypothetical protein
MAKMEIFRPTETVSSELFCWGVDPDNALDSRRSDSRSTIQKW